VSLARIVAMMAGKGSAAYVNSASHDEASSGVPIPSGAQVGDLLVVIYYSDRTLSGGSGAAWTTDTSVPQTKVSYRQLLADDLTVPIVQNAVGPVIVFVFRGPSQVVVRDTLSYSGTTTLYGGFTTSGQELGVLFIGWGSNDYPYPDDPEFPYTFGRSVPTGGFSYSGYGYVGPSSYVDGTDFTVFSGGGAPAGSRAFGIFELRQ
jgi:hypothetical protein